MLGHSTCHPGPHQSPLQRTAYEYINSQVKELGIAHTKVSNTRLVANLSTLTYLIINVHALQWTKAINVALLSIPNGVLQMN
jgi:hypothetical protein